MSLAVAVHELPKAGEKNDAYDRYLTRAAARGFDVPAWVPRRLIPEYVDCATEYGEEHAARHVRKVKKEIFGS